MPTRRQLRRAVIVASIASPLAFVLPFDAIAFESGPSVRSTMPQIQPASKTPRGSIERVQYQPGQIAPPSSGVSAELQKIFEENGQPMPSMNPQDLPNAQGQNLQAVRPTGQLNAGNMNSNAVQPKQSSLPAAASQDARKSPPPVKRNFLQKFADKISGEDTRRKQAEAQVVPPVPPGYQEAVRKPQSSTAAVNGQKQTPARAGTVATNGSPANRVGPTANNATGNTASKSTVAAPSNRANAGARRPIQSVPAVPGNAGNRTAMAPGAVPATVANPNTRTTTNAQAKAQIAVANGNKTSTNSQSSTVHTGTAGSPRVVQPGAAPGFMTNPDANKKTVAAAAQPKASAPPRTSRNGEPPAAPPADDSFIDPFNESPLVDTETLDLDSLSKAATNSSARTTAELADSSYPAASETQTPSDEGLTLPASEDFSATFNQSPNATADNEEGNSAAIVEEQNPFTDVRLPTDETANSDPLEGMFRDEERQESAIAGNGTESVPAVNDFASELPAMELPPVGEEPALTSDESLIPAPVDVSIPAVEGAAVVNARSHELSSDSGLTIPSVEASTASDSVAGNDSSLPAEPVDVSEPQPLRSVDAERLQQAAEQERRLQQQRMIVARNGQSGFKGFCPVALRDRRELVNASAEFTAAFGLQSYTFSSLEARLAFESDPARYAPAAGGSDVVQLVNSSEELPGSLDYALWHRDRLYLFQSRESMTTFARDPQKFASQY